MTNTTKEDELQREVFRILDVFFTIGINRTQLGKNRKCLEY